MTMTQPKVTRRQAITIFAAAAGTTLIGPSRVLADHYWKGVAMGADATILFSGTTETAARAASERIEAEIDRLEGALSLFRQDSGLCRLNRDGALRYPAMDLQRALILAVEIARSSMGLFDPTVQPLWEAYVDWFTSSPAAPLPPENLIADARARVQWRTIAIDQSEIRLGPGQRITLNGLGQGYVTDRIAELLITSGFDHVLVDLGEQRAIGAMHDGSAWKIARDGHPPLDLRQGALATSEGAGCILGAAGAAHHLFDPRTGLSAAHWKTVTVHHRSAAVADALSTAFYVASACEIEALLPRFPGAVVWTRDHSGADRRFGSAAAGSIAPDGV